MKTLSCRIASVGFGFSLFLSAGQIARASISVEGTISFSGVSINPSSGASIMYLTDFASSAYSQAGASVQSGSGLSSTANSSDTPVPGGSATGAGAAATSPLSGSSSATGMIPGTTAGYDTSTGRASANAAFQIMGASGPVSVTFSTMIVGNMSLSSDNYGVYASVETDYALSINGSPVLFSDQMITIGPNQTQTGQFSETLTATMTMSPGTNYYIWMESDAEAMVVNSSVAVPEPADAALLTGGLLSLAMVFSGLRRRQAGRAALLGLMAAGLVLPAHATYLGSEPKNICKTCGARSNVLQVAAAMSMTEGNLQEDYPVVTVGSAYGPTMPFGLMYNSYNADGSRAQLDTGLGFGWTHSYNVMLFQQRGQMFRLGEDGRVTQYYMNYSAPGTYTSAAGYFETLMLQPDGSFIVTNKDKSWWHFGSVPNSPFLIGGPVYQLLQMGDRNNNLTTLSYNGSGLLATVKDPFGRTLQLTYNSSNHLSSLTDPLGRTTLFQYDAQDRELLQITDPLGNTIQYTYNAQYQMTRKVDLDGRMYFNTYKNRLPFMATDGSGQPYFSMANPTNWAVNQSNVAFSLVRQYVPSTTTVLDGNGHTWQYAYDTNAYITNVTAPDGSTIGYTYDPATLGVTSVTDANGNVTRYQYDTNGNRISETDALGNVTTYTYEYVFNQLTSLTDPNGRVTTNNYDSHGNRILSTDPLGQTQSWTYDIHGNVLSMTNKRGYTTQYQYDSNGNLSQMTDPLNDVTTYSNDAIGNRLSMTDANNHTTHYAYDLDDRLIKTTDALGYTNTTTYDGTGHTLSRTDADGHTAYYGYDLRARLVATTNALGGVTQTTYDANENVISRTDENGHVTTYSYDTKNRPISTTDALGNVSTRTFDPFGNTITTTDPNGHTTNYAYDVLNRQILVTDPLGNTTTYDYANTAGPPCCGATAGTDLITEIIDGDGKITYYNYDELNRCTNVILKSGSMTDTITPSDAVTTTTYDPENNSIAVSDPNNNTTKWTYDALNRQIGMTNAAGDVSTCAFDPVGNEVQTVDPRGNVTTSVYDADNRPIQVTDSLGPVLGNSYDGVGNVLSATNGNGNVITTTYDAINRVIVVTDPLGHTTVMAYDPAGNVLNTTDRDGNVSSYTYDADNRQTNVTDALGHASTNAYDPVGNVMAVTDPLGHETTYSYDADNRLIRQTYPDRPSDTLNYGYDGSGHLISRLDQNGQTTTYHYNDFYYMTNRQYSTGPNDQYTYDLGGRITNATRNGWTDSFTYDGANRVLTAIQNGQSVTYSYVIPSGIRTIIYPGGKTVTQTNDLRSRVTTVNDGASPSLSQFTYDLDNNVLMRSNRNGTVANYAYNPNDWLTRLTHSNTATLIAGYAYAYDNVGNKHYQMNQAVQADSEGYSYDALYRLTNFEVGALSGGVIPSPGTNESYGLDPVGNWTTFTSNAVTQTRTYNAVNELLTINASPLAYDANGNLTNDGQYVYSYDVENRLTTATRDSDSALVGQYAYDAFGRRVITIANPAGTPVTNVLFYDGPRMLQEQNAAGMVQANYTYGSYVDEVLTMDRGGQTYYYHPNAVFSVEALTDASGTPVERYAYDAYGEPTVMDGNYNPLPLNPWGTPHSSVGNPYLFTGRQLDEETSLYYYRARFYDALKGRFLQRDPMGYGFGLNLYEYAGGNPTTGLDPLGLGFWSVVGNFAAGVAVGVAVAVVVVVAAPVVASAGAAVLVAAGVSAATAATVASATVTATLATVAVVGTYKTVKNTVSNVQNGNWDAVAYDAGNLVGGLVVGGAGGGRYLARGLSPKRIQQGLINRALNSAANKWKVPGKCVECQQAVSAAANGIGAPGRQIQVALPRTQLCLRSGQKVGYRGHTGFLQYGGGVWDNFFNGISLRAWLDSIVVTEGPKNILGKSLLDLWLEGYTDYFSL